MKNKPKKILITGGAGFIGSHLVDRLVSEKNSIFVIDNLSTGNSGNLNPKAMFYKEDITNKSSVDYLFKKTKPDLVLHLAANANVPLSVRDPFYDFKSLTGTLNIADACVKFNVEKIVYFSSGFIYGNVARRPISENYSFQPISPYSITKKTSEYYLSFYRKAHGLQSIIVRPATIYGPRQNGGAMADYITKLSNGKQAEIYGDGSKTRDYVYIKDLVDALIQLITTNIASSRNESIFNIGTEKETSLNELYFTIANLLKVIPNPIYLPKRKGELEKYCLSYKRLKKTIGWEPKYTIRQGLEETLKFRKLI